MSEEYTYDQMQSEPYAKVTPAGEDRHEYQPRDVWELEITKLLPSIDPLQYFRTTGEGVLKMRRLEADLFAAAGQARKLGNILEKLKDDNVYLETQWQDGRLLLKAKNPRKNKESKLKALKENFEASKAKAKDRFKK